jgi:hypothetical protein
VVEEKKIIQNAIKVEIYNFQMNTNDVNRVMRGGVRTGPREKILSRLRNVMQYR